MKGALPPDGVTSVVGRRTDLTALLALLLLAATVTRLAAGDASRFIRGDWPTFFLPHYAYLGARLRALEIPGWNPYQFSGAPFAADPSSGWMYLPAMLIFALLPPLAAVTALIGAQLILSALGAYWLARLTGIGPGGAFVAAIAYAFPWLLAASSGMVLMTQVTTWLPLALVGVELARRPGAELGRFGGLVLSGLAISQILAAWLGQGGYYALLLIGGWVFWRTVVTPPACWSARQRLAGLFGIGAAVLAIGFALNAAALVIRLDANARSNVPGGVYSGISGWADTKSGLDLDHAARALGGGFSVANWQYLGAAVIALALLAPIVAPRWPPLVFWLAVPVAAVALQLPEGNVLQDAADAVLPRFALLHAHLPDRILLLTPLPAAMLAGATVHALSRSQIVPRWRPAAQILGSIAIAAGAVVLHGEAIISRGALLAALAALALGFAALGLPASVRPVLAPLALAAIVFWDPAGRALAAGWGPGIGAERSLHGALNGEVEAFLEQNGAAAFLHAATRDVPGRYAGYDPALLPDLSANGDSPPQAYRNHWRGQANWLMVLNWGTWFHLEDVQGYNPVLVGRYGEYIDALNGRRQEYHETDLFPEGLDSPLLDLLNLRFLIVPADAVEHVELEPLVSAMPTVYEDAHVRILENVDAFPRAWLVHEANQVRAGEALSLLADGVADAGQIALLETAPPALAPAGDPALESAVYAQPGPDHVSVEISAQAPALLMIGEVWDPGWRATVDGAPVTTYQANFVFQAVPVPAGEHIVELRYTPPLLKLGLGITLGSVVLLMAVATALYRRTRRARSVAGEPAQRVIFMTDAGTAPGQRHGGVHR